jgi:protein-disulfide isomerase
MIPFARSLLLATLALLSAVFVAVGPAAADVKPADKAEIEKIIREYLLKNPEVLRDALNELERRQRDAEALAQKKALEEQKAALFDDPQAIVVGNPKGDVTIVEFFDYNCGYCKRSLADLDKMIAADPKLRIILKDFPILGPDSVAASRIAVALRKQASGDKYWEYHRRLLTETKGRVNADAAFALAASMGFDIGRLKSDAESGEAEAALRQVMDVADALGINGTPAFVIGDQVISGAVGIAPMSKAVASVRQCGKAIC